MEAPSFKFKAEQFGIVDNAIYLLRNGFHYATIKNEEITGSEIQRGKDMQRWPVALGLGVVLLGYAVFNIVGILQELNDPTVYQIYIERLLIPFFPAVLGAYSLTAALRNTQVWVVRTQKKVHYFSLRELIKSGEYEAFRSYVKENFSVSIV